MSVARRIVTLAVASLLVGACTEERHPAPVASTEFASLEAARRAGALGASVLEELRRSGAAEAVVTLRGASVIHDLLGSPEGEDVQRALDALRDALDEMKDRTFRVLGTEVRVLHRYDYLPLVSVRFASEDALLAVLNSPFVRGVSRPPPARLDTDESLPLVRATQAIDAGFTGEGTYVAVLDTGVDYTHEAFGSCTAPGEGAGCRVSHAQDFGTDDEELDDDGHGSNVAGIVVGVAPQTQILAFDVFGSVNEDGEALSDIEDVLAALNEVIRLKREGLDIRAVNMSLGVPNNFNIEDCAELGDEGPNPYAPLFAELRELGVIPVLSAGNSGFGGRPGVGFPACTPGAMRIGAVFDRAPYLYLGGCPQLVGEVDEVTCFSQSGPTLSMWAPGACIVAGGVGEDDLCYGGTSQASPHVAGAVAVLAAARPEATIDQIQEALVRSGPRIDDGRSGGSKHRLDVVAALERLGVDTSGEGTTTVDTTAPTVTAPEVTSEQTITPGIDEAEVTVSWTGTDEDGGSGIAGYRLWVSVDAGEWAEVVLPVTTSTSVNQTLVAGSTYRYAVEATDAAGNVGEWVYSTVVELP